MKRLLFFLSCIFTLCFSSSLKAQPCPTGNITFTTQQQIDAFGTTYAACSNITLANVFIGTVSGTAISDINDLSPLSKITSVNDLQIRSTQVTSLTGLHNISHIGGNFRIEKNALLQNVDALQNNTSIGGYANIRENNVLAQLNGLQNITAIGGYLYLFNNAKVVNLNAFQNVTSVGQYITVLGNSLLTDITGLRNISASTIVSSASTGLILENNPVLSVCNLPNFCTYLANQANFRLISGNAQFCLNEAAVTASCVPCPAGNIEFTTQQQINDFGANHAYCTSMHINGLTIGPYSGTCDITDLSPLQGIASVQSFVIIQRTQLQNMNGLDNLMAIHGNFSIYGNNSLQDFSGLASLESVGGSLIIDSNASIEHLYGLDNLQSTGNLVVVNNSALTDVQGLNGLQNVKDLRIAYNSALLNISALGGVSAINGFLDIFVNPLLNDISGIQSIEPTTITSLNIQLNNNLYVCNLPNICAYLNYIPAKPRFISGNAGSCMSSASLTAVCVPCPTGDITFTTQQQVNDFGTAYPHCAAITLGNVFIGVTTGSSNITDLSPLSHITSVNDLQIRATQLTSLSGLQNITHVGGSLRVHGNPLLQNISELQNMTAIGGYVNIRDNNVLDNLNGLANVASVGGYIYFYNNPKITHLNAFQNVTSVGQYITILGNALLTDISGLGNISAASIVSSANTGLILQNNPVLSVCNLPNFCTYLANPANFRLISGNAQFCLNEAAITASCLPCPTGNLEFTTQQQINDFGANYADCTSMNINGLTIGPYSGTCDITDLSPLQAITLVRSFVIIQRTQLQNMNGLDNLSAVQGNFSIYGNFSLQDFSGLENLENVGGGLTIESNTSVKHLYGFDNLQSIGNLTVVRNGALKDLQGLNNLQHTKRITIQNNNALLNVSGLDNVTAINTILNISVNPVLNDISGIQGIDPATITNLLIFNNSSLYVCNMPNICTYLNYIPAKPRTISGNAGFCLNLAAITASCISYEWTGAVDTDWNTPGNWSQGSVPIATDNVIIIDTDNKPVITGGIAASGNTLTITPGASLTVAPGNVLYVANAADVEQNASLVVHNNAHLIQNANSVQNANTGNIQISRNSSSLYRQDYTLWSSPVMGQNVRDFSENTLLSRFYTYNPLTDHFVSMFGAGQDANAINFAPGTGYLIRMPNGHPAEGYVEGTTPINFEGQFTGVPNNGNITIPVVPQSPGVKGYNAIGNPYPSPISIPAFFAANEDNINGVIYMWRKKNAADVPSAYCTMNSDLEFTTNFQDGGDHPGSVLQTGQGFIVKATGPKINFTNAMRSANTASDSSFFRMQDSNPLAAENNRIWLNLLMADTPVAQMLVGYKSNATMGIDRGIDAPSIGDAATGLNSLIDGVAYTIQGRSLPFDDQDVVPLQFTAAAAGNYSISISALDGLFEEGQNIFIKDNVVGTTHNLKQADYSFASVAGISDTRFELVYVNAALGSDNQALEPGSIIVYKQERSLIINSGKSVIRNVEVFDTRGRLLYKQNNVNATKTILTDLNAEEQLLVVKITNIENSTVSKKIVF